MNILLMKHFVVGFMVSEIPRVSVFGHCPYSITFPYTYFSINPYDNTTVHCIFIKFQILFNYLAPPNRV